MSSLNDHNMKDPEGTFGVFEIPVPFVVGLAEAAEILGLSRARVDQLLKSDSSFPAPIARLKCGPIWVGRDIDNYHANRNRTVGRPRKAT